MTRSPIPFVLALPASLLVISVAADGKSTARSAQPPVVAPSSAVADANRTGRIEPAPPTFINASAVMPFVESTIYHVYTAPERVTDIALQPGEVLGAVASGDTARWVIGDASSGTGADKRSHVLIKPFSVGLTTNLVITTDRRTYHLTVSSGAGGPMSSLSWNYPQDALIALQKSQAATPAAPIAAVLDVDALHFNYSITGDQPQWRPLRAFDDGRQTFIEFPSTLRVGEAPPLFLVGAKGDAQLVNYRLRGRYYVVDRLFEVAELRLGTRHQDIVRIARVGESNFPRAKRRAS